MIRPQHSRPWLIQLSGIFTLALGGGALLIPMIKLLPGAEMVGWLLLLSGLFELVAGGARASDEARRRATVAAGLTCLAGFLFLFNIYLTFFTANYIVIGWLLLRGALLLHMAGRSPDSTRNLVRFAGVADILIGLILVAGLPVAALVIVLFGPTSELVATFALIFAASFFVTGLFLLIVAAREKTEFSQG